MVDEVGPLTMKWVAAAARTVVVPVPATLAVTVSVAVILWPPLVLRVAEKVPTPLVSVASAGSTAAGSVLVKWTVPD
jgi:hypothetical protein